MIAIYKRRFCDKLYNTNFGQNKYKTSVVLLQTVIILNEK